VIKRDELKNPNSCLNRAGDDEIIFVLMARDVAAPAAIQRWVDERVRLGKNKYLDPQIQEALHCSGQMVQQRLEMETTRKQAGLRQSIEELVKYCDKRSIENRDSSAVADSPDHGWYAGKQDTYMRIANKLRGLL
jgi:hypothetical protein